MIAYVFPGQGSQQKGMGGPLFNEFPELTAQADRILGYSIETLCLEDPKRQLGQTQFTQPALFTVNALSFLKRVRETGRQPDFLAGHSLGEYNALLAAGAFDFETGLRLVQKRGELMSLCTGGGMAAVMGVTPQRTSELLGTHRVEGIDVANFNAPTQTVIAGRREEILRIAPFFEQAGIVYIPLNVSGAFHSRFMVPPQQEFAAFIAGFSFNATQIPVIANVSARPYDADIPGHLVAQITRSVQWTDTIRYLMGRGVTDFEEIGPGGVLGKLVRTIQAEAEPLVTEPLVSEPLVSEPLQPPPAAPPAAGSRPEEPEPAASPSEPAPAPRGAVSASTLGSREFKEEYRLRYAYLAGAMYRGISSARMVVALGKAGLMGFLGTGGLEPAEVAASIRLIQQELAHGEPYGVNLLHDPNHPEREEASVDLLLELGVRTVEASAYLSLTPALIRYRAQGLGRDAEGRVTAANRIIAKVSRPEVAEAFLAPAPARLVEQLVREEKLTPEQAELLKQVPVAHDLCAEADSGGHTDGASAFALLPTLMRLRDRLCAQHGYARRIRVGAAGGIGAPEAAAAALVMGADFIVTGSINQCTPEARTSDTVKEMLQQMNVQDTDYAPAADLFELGARVQVLKRGVFFAARANKLYDLYRRHDSLEAIDEKTRSQLQERYFRRGFDEIYAELSRGRRPEELALLERTPKQRMALVFKWYLHQGTRLALEGTAGQEVDYQIHCGPALGAFNQWVKGTPLENWRNRGVVQIGEHLMHGTATLLNTQFQALGAA